MAGEMIRGNLDLLVMGVLQGGALHGYGIIDELRRRSDDTFDLPEGTVYPALHRLERAGLLTSRWQQQAGRRRRVYELTPKGRAELAHKKDEWRMFAAAVGRVAGVTT
jgi:transcriptional regulator